MLPERYPLVLSVSVKVGLVLIEKYQYAQG